MGMGNSSGPLPFGRSADAAVDIEGLTVSTIFYFDGGRGSDHILVTRRPYAEPARW